VLPSTSPIQHGNSAGASDERSTDLAWVFQDSVPLGAPCKRDVWLQEEGSHSAAHRAAPDLAGTGWVGSGRHVSCPARSCCLRAGALEQSSCLLGAVGAARLHGEAVGTLCPTPLPRPRAAPTTLCRAALPRAALTLGQDRPSTP
uniref:Uncharacterized protein n=1 Tax=Meleagris gallopavo TaxID=9103 RepID=A0A803XPJ0_MELGA